MSLNVSLYGLSLATALTKVALGETLLFPWQLGMLYCEDFAGPARRQPSVPSRVLAAFPHPLSLSLTLFCPQCLPLLKSWNTTTASASLKHRSLVAKLATRDLCELTIPTGSRYDTDIGLLGACFRLPPPPSFCPCTTVMHVESPLPMLWLGWPSSSAV